MERSKAERRSEWEKAEDGSRGVERRMEEGKGKGRKIESLERRKAERRSE